MTLFVSTSLVFQIYYLFCTECCTVRNAVVFFCLLIFVHIWSVCTARCVVIGQVEDAASAAMLGRDTNRYCLFLMMTDGCADLRTLKNIMALYFKWVLTVEFGIYSCKVWVSQCVCVCVWICDKEWEFTCVCMCNGVYVPWDICAVLSVLLSWFISHTVFIIFAISKNWYTLQLKRRCSNVLTHAHTHTHTLQRCGHVMTLHAGLLLHTAEMLIVLKAKFCFSVPYKMTQKNLLHRSQRRGNFADWLNFVF